MKLKEKDPAPYFEAIDQNGQKHSLTDYKGQYVLLYFYPKDNTSGCTVEACNLRDNFSALKTYVQILGVSADSEKSHKNFAEKYLLPFPLLADKERKIIQAYGTNGTFFAKRTSFLIDPEGNIAKIYEKVVPAKHATEVLDDIKKMK